MCGVFGFISGMSATEFSKRMGISNIPTRIEDFESFKITPRSTIATVSRQSPNTLVPRIWWLAPPWVDDPYRVKFATFNARSEGVASKPAFRHAWKHNQRCLIPASYFVEWETTAEGEKLPYKVTVKDQALFAFAGLYEDIADAEGKLIRTATMLTTHSVQPLSNIHKRQPVILDADGEEAWLDPDTPHENIQQLLQPIGSLQLEGLPQSFNKSRASEITAQFMGL